MPSEAAVYCINWHCLLQELEKELSKYRKQEAEESKKKASSGSLWSYMAGTS
jgi:hypothetical protein